MAKSHSSPRTATHAPHAIGNHTAGKVAPVKATPKTEPVFLSGEAHYAKLQGKK
ncbi:MAG: hypothetical protein ACP5O7_13400 [Phycisphaerae bacterium]